MCDWNFDCCCSCLVAKLCLTFCDPMDYSLPGSSVYGIFQARILEWFAISFSRGSSQPGIKPVSLALAGGFFTTEPPGKCKSLLCPTLCDPMDYTVCGILQARILEWVAYPFSSRSFWPRNRTGVSCIAGRIFISWATREAYIIHKHIIVKHTIHIL